LSKRLFIDCGSWGRLEPEVTSPFDYGSLLVFNTHYSSSMQHSTVISDFLIVDYSEMPISSAKGRSRPEVTSTIDRATMHGFLTVINACFRSIVQKLYAIFFQSKMAFLSISAAKGRARPEMTSPFESSNTVSY
jgi:hypothetical protein